MFAFSQIKTSKRSNNPRTITLAMQRRCRRISWEWKQKVEIVVSGSWVRGSAGDDIHNSPSTANNLQ